MDAETKEYFEEFKNALKALDTKFDKLDAKVDRNEKKNSKEHEKILSYIEHLNSELQEHRHNSEMHQKVAIG